MYYLEKKVTGKLYIRMLITILYLMVFLGGCKAWHTPCVVLLNEETGRIIARLPFNPQGPITLEFINSIYHAPVRETLMFEPPGVMYIIMVESPSQAVFQYYGLESDPTGKALLHRKVEKIRIRSSDYDNHRITVGKQTFHLKGAVPNGELVILSVQCDSHCNQ